jgi:hypothetical protein
LPNYNKTFAGKLKNCCGGAYLSLALLSPILLPGAPVLAQVADAARPARQTNGGHRGASIDDRVKVFAKNLDLNEAQQAAVKEILEQRQQETLRIRLDPTITGGARIARFRVLQDNTVERIRVILNEEQRKKYDPFAPRRIQPAPQQQSSEDWIKATAQQ